MCEGPRHSVGCAHCRSLDLTAAAAAAATQELAKQMLQQANELLAIDLLSGRQVVKLSIGLAHVLTLEVLCSCRHAHIIPSVC